MRIGIDLGGTKIEGIILDEHDKLVTRHRKPTPTDSYQETVDQISAMVAKLQAQLDSRVPVGIGIPGAISTATQRMKNCNSTCLNNRPLKQDIESALGYEVRLENDANCFVLSEARLGSAREYNSVFGVILGTGVGGGLYINGELLSGRNRIGGEWGHNPLPASVLELIGKDRQCYCGRCNCIETVLSGPGLSRSHAEVFGEVLDAMDIAKAASEEDADCRKSLDTHTMILAACLATVINVVDPQAIVLGGGLSNTDSFYKDLPGLLPDYVFSDSVETVILRPEHGDASGALGAACLWPKTSS